LYAQLSTHIGPPFKGAGMDTRLAKAKELAERGRCARQEDGTWVVASLTRKEKYTVTLGRGGEHHCTCPDFELRQAACKHVRAVLCVINQEAFDRKAGNPPRDRQATGPPAPYPRQTYQQHWPSYDAAQQAEKGEFLMLLAELCAGIVAPERKPGRGRKPALLRDQAFAALFKVYATVSGRRFTTDLEQAQAQGFLTEALSHVSIARFLESEGSTPLLRALVTESAVPLKALEKQFAVDSTGFSACKFDRWYDEKWGRMRSEAHWVKAHAMVGTLTNCVSAALVIEQDSNDCPHLPPLVKQTATGFKIEECSADKAYAALENYAAIAAAGGTPYIAFRSNHNGSAGGLWERMFHLFSLEKDEFLRHYHRRSNAESTFSAVKRLFGDSVRSKTETAMRNEVYCKLVCYNITCVIHQAHELGIDYGYKLETGSDPVSEMILKFPF
jgi:transposase